MATEKSTLKQRRKRPKGWPSPDQFVEEPLETLEEIESAPHVPPPHIVARMEKRKAEWRRQRELDKQKSSEPS
jgi:hypothetical protein